MEENFIVLAGNENGVELDMDSDIDYLDEETANNKYNEFIEDYGCAVMYKAINNKLKRNYIFNG